MNIGRRGFIAGSLATSAGALLPSSAFGQAAFAPKPEKWRSFDITTRLDLAAKDGASQAWLPLPSVREDAWMKPNGADWRTNGKATVFKSGSHAPGMLRVEWTASEKAPFVELTNRIATRDRSVDLDKREASAPLSSTERKFYLAATDLIPTDGIVKQTSDKITAGARTDVDKARAIYEWVVDNSFRRASTRGCGIGDVAAMLKSGDLGGKCADLNALFVGLVRAQGIPARDIYGIRVAPSVFGYKSLGANSATITKAQHCRAEVHLVGLGWVPMDPADVRKVVLEESPGNLSADDPRVVGKSMWAHRGKLPVLNGSNGPSHSSSCASCSWR